MGKYLKKLLNMLNLFIDQTSLQKTSKSWVRNQSITDQNLNEL